LSGGDGVVFGLVGAAAALLGRDLLHDRRFVLPWAGAWITTLGITAWEHQFGAACFVLGIAAVTALEKFSAVSISATSYRARYHALAYPMALFFAMIALLTLISEESRSSKSLPRSDFDRAVTQRLQELGAPAAMVVSTPSQHRLQSRIGHPVLADSASADSLVYSPELAPSIQKILYDLYGIRFHPPLEPNAPSWSEIWIERSHSRWVELAQRYGFSFVISPNDTPLHLEAVLPGVEDTLYRISD